MENSRGVWQKLREKCKFQGEKVENFRRKIDRKSKKLDILKSKKSVIECRYINNIEYTSRCLWRESNISLINAELLSVPYIAL